MRNRPLFQAVAFAEVLDDKRALRIIGNATQGSRFLLTSKTGLVRIFGNWVEDHGIYYSNGNYKPRFVYDRSLFDNTAYDTWAAFGDIDDDLARYGMFEACKDCPMLFECAEYLPVCTDATDEVFRAVADTAVLTPGCCKKPTRDEIFDILVECR